MYKVFVLKYWTEPHHQTKNRFLLQKPNDFKYFELVDDIEIADFIIILDRIVDRNLLSKRSKNSKVFLMQREPTYVGNLDKSLINICDYHFLYENNNNITFVAWWLDYNYEDLKKLKYEDLEKKFDHICITSNKNGLYGHRLRNQWLSKIQDMIHIDFYGKNLKHVYKNYKGIPEDFCESNTVNRIIGKNIIGNYHKSFSFDNGQQRNFITRVNEDFLMWTLPLYWGCPNIDEIYPKNSYRYIDIKKSITKELIEYIKEPVTKDELLGIEEARLLVLDKYNFWFYIKDKIESL